MTLPAMLYYFPVRSVLRRALCRVGLWRLAIKPTPRRMAQAGYRNFLVPGPDGNLGLVASPPECAADIGRHLDVYWWSPGPGVWRGIRPNYMPAEFSRSDAVDGKLVALADGKLWCIPVAAGGPPGFEVQRLSPSGGSPGDASRRIVALQAAALWRRRNQDGTQIVIDDDELYAAAARMVAVNYDLDGGDMDALGLLSSEACTDIVRAVIGVSHPESMERVLAAAELLMANVEDRAGGCR